VTTPVVLFLNAGRRVELLESFRRAFRSERRAGRIVATEIRTDAPAWHMADAGHILPPSRAPEFIEALIALCRQERVDLIVPLIDPDLPVLATNRTAIEAAGAAVLISSAETIRVCGDKSVTSEFLSARALPIIPSLSIAEARAAPLPLVVKPRNGSASINVYTVTTHEQLEVMSNLVSDPLIQPYVVGDEYTVDVFSDPHDGRTLSTVPRRRLKVRSGEVSVARIERHPPLEKLAGDVAEAVGLRGPGNIQFIVAADAIWILEVNPRFGGGCPLSIEAGAPYVGWCLDIAMRRPLRHHVGSVENGLLMMRYDMSLFVRTS